MKNLSLNTFWCLDLKKTLQNRFLYCDRKPIIQLYSRLLESHHLFSEDITLAVCPGICNSSESIYIRRVVYHAQFQGFRVAVLNHVGALKNVPVTSPRIFNYGEWIPSGLVRADPKYFRGPGFESRDNICLRICLLKLVQAKKTLA